MGRTASCALGLCLSLSVLPYFGRGADPTPTFITAPVERGTIARLVKATGSVEPVTNVDVSSELSGRIADVFVNFNDAVSAGQPIARLDQEIFAARVSEATAALSVARASAEVQRAVVERAMVAVRNAASAQRAAEAEHDAAKAKEEDAERELQRKLSLAKTGVATGRELSQTRTAHDVAAAEMRAAVAQINMKEQAIAMADAELRMATAGLHNAEAVIEERQAALDQTRLDLDRTVMRAPIAGVILKRDVNPGQTVAVALEAKTLFKIADDLVQMEIHARVDEADVGQLRPGQKAVFTVDAYPERVFSGEVRQIRKSAETTQNVVTYTAIISAPNPDLLLFPGMTALLRIDVSDGAEVALKIPNKALRFRPSTADVGGESRVRPGLGRGTSSTVWIPDEAGRPAPIRVIIGLSDDKYAQLLDGPLVEGESLIVGVASDSRPDSRRSVVGLRTEM
jgi:HlyD family secretion protein